MYKPVCAAPHRRTQSVQKQGSAKVICEVEAYPPQVNFTWKFNGSSEGEALPLESIENHGTISALNYTTAMEQDFGTLLCWATNAIGSQRKPCVIHLVPQARPPNVPAAPINCSIANQSSEAISVVCAPAEEMSTEEITSRPEWWVGGLQSGTGVRLSIRSVASSGASLPVTLEADIMKVAEKRMGPPEEISMPPVIGAVIGGVGVVVLLLALGLLLARYAPKCCASRADTDRIPNTPPPHPRAGKDIALTSLKCAAENNENIKISKARGNFVSSSSLEEEGSLMRACPSVESKASEVSGASSVSRDEGRGLQRSSGQTEETKQFAAAEADGLHNNPDLVLGTG
ncbi:hypothetical protein HAZT_HAZT002874 [Hyalella azteca]|uniref:Ig-like domain-containing protein n=1 Tax=Hyalella azteca TaxID=294128 RepID=A0A6A0GS72_HYAAZ|nr:hypothetical protein HAZT_HAZT002874 [Hyalella azteca]